MGAITSEKALIIASQTVKATKSISANRFITAAGSYPAAGSGALGITEYAGGTNDFVSTVTHGIYKVLASGTVPEGPVKSDASGQAVAMSGGEIDVERVGWALDAVSDGAYTRVRVPY